MQYLYQAGDNYSFMDMNTYEQVELSETQIGDALKFLKENLEVDIVFFGEEIIGLNLPEKIDYVITETENAVKKFQEIFDLPVTGKIDKTTWYKIKW